MGHNYTDVALRAAEKAILCNGNVNIHSLAYKAKPNLAAVTACDPSRRDLWPFLKFIFLQKVFSRSRSL